ncbi:tripartite tricarboxylate transporter permease [Rhodovulum euryhalinum]|uniref:Putative tricarboxylic transport membrane protein n=1 Tax=Rhodovulum euryhalinum TaxID=35805 RepID=A0A4R2KBG7_9RHOB|nr:tripartite tricarboxylate transporter permease [Rhodovulum euryhalinum]TCO70831.1 putative tricarboxylic transport membrane protein [Rhodovulum euryhalinum]
MDLLLTAAQVALAPAALLAVLAGTLLGVIFGAIPGLTFTVAMALVVPMSFSLETAPAIGLLLGTYIGGMTGGSVPAILLGIPGTPSAAATVLDGYPLTRRGKASLALGTAVVASAFGGIVSLIVMVVSVDMVAKLALRFGPAETFGLLVFGLSTICGLAQKSLVKGLIAGVLGLMVMTIGIDEMEGVQRLTFGTVVMQQGISLLVAMIALFAVPHVIDAFVDHYTGGRRIEAVADVRAELPTIRDILRDFWLMLRCALLGTGIGAIPGTGGPIAAFLAYAHAQKSSKRPERFGKGEMAGVVAPETANNAVTGGAMIPLLSLGIPGDPATAILLSGLLIHGLIPGPMLFIQNPGEIYQIYLAIIVAYVSVVAIQLLGIRFFVQVLRVPAHLLAVGIIIMCAYGAFAIRNSVFDVISVAVLGAMAYGLMRVGIPLTPIILGLVLGPAIEREFRTAMILSEGDPSVFVGSLPAAVFLGLAVLIVGTQVVRATRATLSARRTEDKASASVTPSE